MVSVLLMMMAIILIVIPGSICDPYSIDAIVDVGDRVGPGRGYVGGGGAGVDGVGVVIGGGILCSATWWHSCSM